MWIAFANNGATVAGGVRTWSSSSNTLLNTVINQGFSSPQSIQIARVASQYVAGPATFDLAYSNTQYGADTLSAFTQNAKFNNGSAFFNWQFPPVLRAGFGYSYTSLTSPSSAHYNQVNLGADYALSKRTDVYALFGYQQASGNTPNASGAIVKAAASVGSYGVNSGTDTQELCDRRHSSQVPSAASHDDGDVYTVLIRVPHHARRPAC